MGSLPTVTIATTDGTAKEGVAGDGLSFTLTRTGDLSQALTVNTYVNGWTSNAATMGQDFVAAPSTVTFKPGSATAVLKVTIIDDTVAEATEGLSAYVFEGNGYQRTPLQSIADASILDNDSGSTPLPTVTIATTDGTAKEGVAGDGLSFTLTRTGNLSQALTVNTYVNGWTSNAATMGQDFVAAPSTVTFKPGSATAVLKVTIIDDTVAEATEGLSAYVFEGNGYQRTPLQSIADASILDNDSGSTPLPTVTIATTDGTAKEGVAGDGLSFTLTRTGNLSQALTVNTYVNGWTSNAATMGQDFVAAPITVTFKPGSATAVLKVTIIDDTVAEATEGLSAYVFEGSGYQRTPLQSIADASIHDNDITNGTFNGGTGNDILYGEAGNDTLNGGAGADLLYGRGGNDLYYVDNAGDRVFETAGNGADRVLTSVSYKLAAGQEIERLDIASATGTAAINLTGNEITNALLGNAGANTLNGGAGADLLYGRGGNDLYYVDNAGDRVFETAGNGADRVLTSVSYKLAAGQEIERLDIASATGTAAINLTGNEITNALLGNAGANTLNGGAGADLLYGRGGNDLYYVDNAGDRVFETAGNGADRVLTSVSYKLAAGQEIERLDIASATGTAAINLTGNEITNALLGNAGANTLNGGAGADLLYGRGGNDTFVFSTAVSAGNIDRITDFAVTDDTVQLARSVFSTLSMGQLTETAFKDLGSVGAELDANDRILYNHTTGALSYDADGSGTAKTALQFAIIDTKAALTHLDFIVV
ncbi:beta strand repeat-containing protein [Methylobacterium sp. CM6241]